MAIPIPDPINTIKHISLVVKKYNDKSKLS